jgi:hypothetical protein
MYVVVGSSRRLGQGGSSYRALRIFIHPEYNYQWDPKFIMKTDIAVIRTFLQIRFNELVQPIPFGIENVPSDQQVVILGWGLTLDDDVILFNSRN